MPNYNKWTGIGRITREIELKFTPKGLAVGKFGMAINRTWNDEAGNKKEEATFVDIDCFGKQAENVQKHFTKGSHILVEGRLKLDQWDEKTTGQKRSKLGVVMEGFQFIDPKQDGEKSQGQTNQRPTRTSESSTRPAQFDDESGAPF